MKEWLKISCLLCAFGFLREIRPSESFITEYLLGPWRNVTQDQINRDVYPMVTYSCLAQMVIVFLITDFLRYKPLIVTIGVTGIIIFSMFIWTTSLEALLAIEFFYGTYVAAEIAYFTYIYAKVDKKYYLKVTSYTRAAKFTGKLIGCILAQILVVLDVMDYMELNYITLGTQIFATIWAFGLPKVDRSLYFHRQNDMENIIQSPENRGDDKKSKIDGSQKSEHMEGSIPSPFKLLWEHFYNAYTNLKVVQWSILYALSWCGFMLVNGYIQVLWKDIDPNIETAWNGAVNALFTGLAAISALAAGYIHTGLLKHHTSLLILAIIAVLEGGTVLLSCWTQSIYVSYIGFVLFGGLFGFTITVSSAEVARHLEEESFGLVFGINTFLSFVIQTIVTLAVISEWGFALSATGQYTVYAFYFMAIGFIYFLSVAIEYFISRTNYGNAIVEKKNMNKF